MVTELNSWNDFCVIVGGAAGALIGLQFIVITLISGKPVPKMAEAGKAFTTPTIVHFSVVLALAATLCAPWNEAGVLSLFMGLLGIAGMIYSVIVAQRMKTQGAYAPDMEDWAFHVALPFVSYLTFFISSFEASSSLHSAMFFVAAALLLLLMTGIHNAWDAVTYHTFFVRNQ